MTRTDNVLNMQITIANCMKQEWGIDYGVVSNLLDEYDLLSYIDICYEEYNTMGTIAQCFNWGIFHDRI